MMPKKYKPKSQQNELKLWGLHHPHMSETFIVLSEDKGVEFIKKNQKIWEKYDIDPNLFISELAWIKDNQIIKTLKEGMPELFL